MFKKIKFVSVYSGGTKVTELGVGSKLSDKEGQPLEYTVRKFKKSLFSRRLEVYFTNGDIVVYPNFQIVYTKR